MTVRASQIGDLPNALSDRDALDRRLDDARPAVFLDYDGTLTPLVERPEDPVISDHMRDTVRRLAERCTIWVVSSRDRRLVQELMGVHDLDRDGVFVGNHDDPEVAGRTTAADFVLSSIDEVERLLDTLAR